MSKAPARSTDTILVSYVELMFSVSNALNDVPVNLTPPASPD